MSSSTLCFLQNYAFRTREKGSFLDKLIDGSKKNCFNNRISFIATKGAVWDRLGVVKGRAQALESADGIIRLNRTQNIKRKLTVMAGKAVVKICVRANSINF